MALTVAIILALFAPWPWNLIAILTGLGIETVELTWGLRLARRWRPQTGAEAMIGDGGGGYARVAPPARSASEASSGRPTAPKEQAWARASASSASKA